MYVMIVAEFYSYDLKTLKSTFEKYFFMLSKLWQIVFLPYNKNNLRIMKQILDVMLQKC